MNYKTKRLRGTRTCAFFMVAALSIFFNSCDKVDFHDLFHGDGNHQHANEGRQTLMAWNYAATEAVRRMGLTGPALPPMPESRIYAIVNIAMYDALNSIKPKNRAYAYLERAATGASIDAAIATAGHDALTSMLPPQATYVDSLLSASLSAIGDGIQKQKGIETGKAAAAAILAKRDQDGASTAQSVSFIQGTLPGEYRSTIPFDGAPFNGFVAVPGWGKVTPFGLNSADQFRPEAPYAITSAAYTKDYNEVKSIGSDSSTARTSEQKEIALFWLPNAPFSFNGIARNLIFSKNLDTWKASRLLTLVAMAEADANIGAFEAKFYYHFWRPITAIRLGDADGNPATAGDPAWNVLEPPTPPIPDYPSNHAVNGGAGAEVLKDFFGTDNIAFDATSSRLPGVTRHYNSFSQAAMDNALSRIYVGYHFRNSCMKGLTQGKLIGKYTFDHYLQEE